MERQSAANWYALNERPGYLRLRTQALAADAPLRAAPAILAQKLPAPSFVVDTHIELRDAVDGDRAGLMLNGLQYAWLGLRRHAGATALVYTVCTTPPASTSRCNEEIQVVLADAPSSLILRIDMREGASARFAYSVDKRNFTAVGTPFAASKGRWVGSQLGLFSVGTDASASHLDVDYFRITAPDRTAR